MLSAQQRATIRRIEITASRLVRSQLAGQYHSVFKGRGMAFAEVREYMPGDDVRSIDWNVSARMNRAHVKLFGEERDRTLMLMVDMSASGRIGSGERSKRELAAELAAVLAFSAIANGDRVGLICFTDKVERYVAPKKGKKHVLRVVREILDFDAQSRGTQLSSAFEFIAKVSKRRTVAFVISDFLDREWGKSMRLLARRHDLVPVRLRDPIELVLPAMGFVMMEDIESGALFEVDSSGPGGREFRRRIREEDQRFVDDMRRMQLDFLDLNTQRPYEAPLVDFFRRRERKRGGLP